MGFFSKFFKKQATTPNNDDVSVQSKIEDTLQELLPEGVEISTRIENGKCVAIIQNCSLDSGEVDFDKIGPALLKYSKQNEPVKMNWKFEPSSTGEFYRLSNIIDTEKDVNKKLEACEASYPLLKKFCRYCIETNNELPPVINCRDVGFELYMRLGLWDEAKRVFMICESANAYYPDKGEDEQNYLIGYKNISTKAFEYIAKNPGCLQKDMYQVMNVQGEDREYLKHFLRCSLQITKEKCGNTNKLFVHDILQ